MNQKKYLLHIGWDWAYGDNAVLTRNLATQKESTQMVPTEAHALHQWAEELQGRYAQGTIAIGIERLDGACVKVLQQYDCFDIYQFNPRAVKAFRTSRSVSQAKSDPGDAQLLADMLTTHLKGARKHAIADDLSRQLDMLVRMRRKLVQDRLKLLKQLAARLNITHPALLKLWRVAELERPVVLDLLTRWPRLSALQNARVETLRKHLYDHNLRSQARIEDIIETLRSTRAITEDGVELEIIELEIGCLISMIKQSSKNIGKVAQKIAAVWARHDERAFYEALPGAGEVLAPRLAALLGTDRKRWNSAQDLLAFAGIAPVKEASGQSCRVHIRRSAPKYLRQTLHEFSKCSIPQCPWARAFYQMKCKQGKTHNEAVRALAYKWGRILWKCWMDQTPYDESRYLESLIKRKSPIIQALADCG